MAGYDPIVLTFSLALLGLVPLVFVTTTSFLKIAIVLSLMALGLRVDAATSGRLEGRVLLVDAEAER